MEANEKPKRTTPIALTLHGLKTLSQLLIPLLLGLTAAWIFLTEIGANRAALAQEEQIVAGLDPLAPQPVLVTTIPLPVLSPLAQASVAVNAVTGYVYVLARAQYPYSNANLMIISGTKVIASNTSTNYKGVLTVNSNLGYVYIPVVGGVATISGTKIVNIIPVDRTLVGNAISVEPNSGFVYVDGYDWFTVCILETPWCGGIVWVLTNGGGTRLNVGGRVAAIGVNTVTGYVYATYRTGGLWDFKGTVVISDTEEITRLPIFGEAIGVNPNNGYVYLAEAAQNRVQVLNGTQVLQTLPVGIEPRAIGVNPRTDYVYIANKGSNNVTVISATLVMTTLPVDLAPEAIAVNPDSGYVYVAHAGNNTLSVISGTQIISSLAVGSAPRAIGVNPETGFTYVVNYDDATVSIIREMILPFRIYLPLLIKH
jgi:DNA-binding beta-propeller fold protein YncE